MKKPVDGRYGQAQQLAVVEGVQVQKVVQWSQRVIMGNEPKLRYRVARGHVGTDVTEDALVAE